MAPGTTAGGVLTRSLTASAPVESCRAHLKGGSGRVLVVNAGNANTFTGRRGVADVTATCGSGGVRLQTGRSVRVVHRDHRRALAGGENPDRAAADEGASCPPDAWMDAARAIMTTDTFPKVATRTAVIDGANVTINGFCKGSGMIAPDMGTMLAYVFTDAALSAPVAQALIAAGADKSFNCMTVDSDTSTSDTLLMFATGKAKHAPVITRRRSAAWRISAPSSTIF